MPVSHLSRRGFLYAAGFSAAALAAGSAARRALAQTNAPEDPLDELLSWNELYGNPPLLGRVHGAARLRIFDAPTPTAISSRAIYSNDIIPLYGGVHGEVYDFRTASDVWFQTDGGYVHSAYVVPCHETFNEPEDVIDGGFWGEITVPLCWQHEFPVLNTLRHGEFYYYRGYWQQVYRIIEREDDDAGLVWYRVEDELAPRRRAWILARNIRRLREADFAPISPEVTDKRIEIYLDSQTLTCFEENVPVFQTRIASGTSIVGDDGTVYDFSTPYGNYRVERKRPGRRMRGVGASAAETYDVNAVPWVTYFTGTGAAIHGAYWHNNFGTPRSHGCINVTPDAGHWIFRWTQPFVTAEDDYNPYRYTERGEAATPVIVT